MNKAVYIVSKRKNREEIDLDEHSLAIVKAENVRPHKFSVSFTVKINRKVFGEFIAPVIGDFNVENLLPGIYVAQHLGMKASEIRAALSTLANPKDTMEAFTHTSGAVLLNDTHNANPMSVAAAAHYMKLYKGKKIMVLQPLIELGKNAKKDHLEIGKVIGETCDILHLTNKNYYKEIVNGVRSKSKSCKIFVSSATDVVKSLRKLGKEDVVVFEGREALASLSRLKATRV